MKTEVVLKFVQFVIYTRSISSLMKTEVVLKSKEQLRNCKEFEFNENRSCIEINSKR